MFGKKKRDKERRKGAFTFGFMICLGAAALLFWNESRAVNTAKGLREGMAEVLSVAAESVNPENEGKLIHLTGLAAASGDAVQDPELQITFPEKLAVKRTVEMYQWKGKKEGKSDDAPYKYSKVWKTSRINSEKYADDHKNPPFILKQKKMTAPVITIEAFILSTELAKQIKPKDKLLIEEALLSRLHPAMRNKAMLYNGGIYIAAGETPDPDNPAVGDVRVSYFAADPMDVSLIALQKGSQLTTYQSSSGISIALLEPGNVSASQMFSGEVSKNTALTWFMRIFGILLMFGAFRMMHSHLVTFLQRIPGIGQATGFGVNILSVLLAFGLSLLIIGASWLFNRPIIIIYFVAAGVLIFFAGKKYFGTRNVRQRHLSLKKEILQLAMKKGGRLTLTEAAVGCRADVNAAEKALTELVQDGVAGMDVTDDGLMLYTFSEMQILAEKNG